MAGTQPGDMCCRQGTDHPGERRCKGLVRQYACQCQCQWYVVLSFCALRRWRLRLPQPRRGIGQRRLGPNRAGPRLSPPRCLSMACHQPPRRTRCWTHSENALGAVLLSRARGWQRDLVCSARHTLAPRASSPAAKSVEQSHRGVWQGLIKMWASEQGQASYA